MLAEPDIFHCETAHMNALTFSQEWTIVDDPPVSTKQQELLNSMCVGSGAEKLRQDMTPFEVVLLPIEEGLGSPLLTRADATEVIRTMVVTQHEIVFENKDDIDDDDTPKIDQYLVVPLRTIAKVEVNKQVSTVVDIWCKDFRNLRLRFVEANSVINFCGLVQTMVSKPCPAFCKTSNVVDPGWRVFSWQQEFFVRQQLPDTKWKLVNFNKQYELCRSYPPEFIVPENVLEKDLIGASGYRSRGRLPVLTWYCHRNHASLSRSSQPMVGMLGMRSPADEKLVREIYAASSPSKPLNIVDCRPWVKAMANAARGAGTEKIAHYPNCKLLFMNIENIHTMRKSFQQIAELCRKKSNYEWFSTIKGQAQLAQEGQSWLAHTSLVLKAAVSIAELIEDGSSVLVHCSDGWDRTSQLCALAQLLLDPYYRTIQGFEVLIEKDWLAFGHKFATRSAHKHQNFFDTQECSPIFLQFMDCVWQLRNQFEAEFEYNEHFLITIMDHVYSCKFGTFLVDNNRQRVQYGLPEKTPSLWTHINLNKADYISSYYAPTGMQVLRPVSVELALWKSYYLRYHTKSKLHTTQVIKEENNRLGAKVAELEKQLAEAAQSKLQLQQELGKVNKEKEKMEEVMQSVQCTVYRSEGEKPYLVAKFASPTKDLTSHFCDDLSHYVIENYASSPLSSPRACSPGRSTPSPSSSPCLRSPTAAAMVTPLGHSAPKSTKNVATGRKHKLAGSYSAYSSPTSMCTFVTTKERKHRSSDDRRYNSVGYLPDDEDEDLRLCAADEGWTMCGSPPPSVGFFGPGMGPALGWNNEPTLNVDVYPDQEEQSPEEAAWALRDEVVRLEVSDETGGSWSHPIRFADYLTLAQRYLRDHGLDISKFRWPYSAGN